MANFASATWANQESRHARTISQLAAWFGNHEAEWGIQTALSAKVQTTPTRVRVPDVVLVQPGANLEFLTHPPIRCDRSHNRKNTFMDMRDWSDEYLKMGIKHVWFIDPRMKSATIAEGRTFRNCGINVRLYIAGTPIYLDVIQWLREVYVPWPEKQK